MSGKLYRTADVEAGAFGEPSAQQSAARLAEEHLDAERWRPSGPSRGLGPMRLRTAGWRPSAAATAAATC